MKCSTCGVHSIARCRRCGSSSSAFENVGGMSSVGKLSGHRANELGLDSGQRLHLSWAFSSQNCMSISRYIVVAVVRCSAPLAVRRSGRACRGRGDSGRRAGACPARSRARAPGGRRLGRLGLSRLSMGCEVTPSSLQTPGFPAPLPLLGRAPAPRWPPARAPREPSRGQVGLGQDVEASERRPRIRIGLDASSAVLQQRHRLGRAPRPESRRSPARRANGSTTGISISRQIETALQQAAARREVSLGADGLPEAIAGPDLAVGMAGASAIRRLPRLRDGPANSPSSARRHAGRQRARHRRRTSARPKRSPGGAPSRARCRPQRRRRPGEGRPRTRALDPRMNFATTRSPRSPPPRRWRTRAPAASIARARLARTSPEWLPVAQRLGRAAAGRRAPRQRSRLVAGQSPIRANSPSGRARCRSSKHRSMRRSVRSRLSGSCCSARRACSKWPSASRCGRAVERPGPRLPA